MPHLPLAAPAPLLALALTVAGCAAPPAAQPAADRAPEPRSGSAAAASSAPVPAWPGITVDPQRRYIDVAATVATRQGDWMELLACSPGTLEYESILTVQAKPSHIHLALLTLGLEPGDALSYQDTGDGYRVIPPHGPPVAITILTPQANPEEHRNASKGDAEPDSHPKTTEIPANQWVRNQVTQEPLPDNIWIFTGSSFAEYEGRRVYMADLNGTVITLVNFGEDLLARPTDLTNQTDAGAWNVNTDLIPPVGTPVTLRLRPANGDRTITAPITAPIPTPGQ